MSRVNATPWTPPAVASDGGRHPAVWLALGCAVFIIDGSLFPFDFQAVGKPFASVFADWDPWLNRSDAVDNVILFAPLGAALFFACPRAAQRGLVSLISVALLGFGLQVMQLYLPSRVASIADTVNNAIGLALGMGAASAVAPRLRRRQLLGRMGDPLALLLVGAWYCYESFPFVPTLDIGLLAGHIKPMLASLAAGPSAFEPERLLRHLLAALLGTLALLAARPLASRHAALWATGGLLVLSELVVPYGALRLEALAGIVLGIVVGDRLERRLGEQTRRAVLAIAAGALLFTVVTDFRPPAPGSRFTLTPFSHVLWVGTTAGVPTAAFEALAIGALMWAGVTGPRPSMARAWAWPALVTVAVVMAEGLRVLLRSGVADSSTVVTALLLAPFATQVHRAGRGVDIATPAPPRTPEPPPPAGRRSPLWSALAAIALLTLGLRAALSLPGMPYNVLELFPDHAPWRLALFALALLWIGAGPWWAARTAAGQRPALLWLPLLVTAAAFASLLLLRITVTQESLDDITGSTDLYRRVTVDGWWGEAWRQRMAALPGDFVGALERGVRYVALYGVLLVPLTGVAVVMDRGWPAPRAWPAIVVLGLMAWGVEWIVIDQAITDNLTELIAVGGLPFLAAGVLLFAINVGVAARPGRGGAWARLLPTLLMTAIALPLVGWLGTHGLEQVLIKYDTVGSAQQFLLGHDRYRRLGSQALFERWCAVYLAMLFVCAFGMALARRLTTPALPRRLAR